MEESKQVEFVGGNELMTERSEIDPMNILVGSAHKLNSEARPALKNTSFDNLSEKVGCETKNYEAMEGNDLMSELEELKQFS